MTPTDLEPDRLRREFQEGLAGSAEVPDDKELDRIWDAVGGRLSEDEARTVLDEVLANPGWARSWLMARRVMEESQGAVSAPAEPDRPGATVAARSSFGWPLQVAAALSLAIVAAVGWSLLRDNADPPYRGDGDSVESLLPDGVTLPRDGVVFRWEGGPEGTVHQVWVFDESFGLLFAVDEVLGTTLLVPEERLASLADGDILQWQVESRLPSGERIRSAPFQIRISAAGNPLPAEENGP